MKTIIIVLISLIICSGCKSQINDLEKSNKKNSIKDSSNYDVVNDSDISKDFEEGFDAPINIDEFNKWRGRYEIANNYVSGLGDEFIDTIKLNFFKPDSCIYESIAFQNLDNNWKEISKSKILGSLYPKITSDSVEFYSSKYLIGESMNLSPVFTLIRKNGKYFISSILTSPPHNGIIEMQIEKIE